MTEHKARKRFGQNFLHDRQVIDRLVAAIAPKAGDNMVEIGPGQGALTAPLLEAVASLHAIELDRDLFAMLQTRFAGGKLDLYSADALRFDFAALAEGRPLRVVGNLPYNISTPLLFHLFGFRQHIADMHFMLQQEVVDRLAAEPGNKSWGRLGIMAQYYCRVEKLFTVPPGAFKPPPKVMSAIVRLTPEPPEVNADNPAFFADVVRASFAQRRKTLRNNLKALLPTEQLDKLQQDLTLRPEQLSVADYVRLSNRIGELQG